MKTRWSKATKCAVAPELALSPQVQVVGRADTMPRTQLVTLVRALKDKPLISKRITRGSHYQPSGPHARGLRLQSNGRDVAVAAVRAFEPVALNWRSLMRED